MPALTSRYRGVVLTADGSLNLVRGLSKSAKFRLFGPKSSVSLKSCRRQKLELERQKCYKSPNKIPRLSAQNASTF